MFTEHLKRLLAALYLVAFMSRGIHLNSTEIMKKAL